MRSRAVAVVALLALLVAGLTVPAAAAGWITTTVSITSGGLARSYLLERPASSPSTLLPVVVELHGCCTTPGYEVRRSGFLTTARDAILVFPAGYEEVWNAGACCGNTQVDDVAFIAAVVKQVLESSADADPARVYLAGYSNGGRMAYRVACERPGLFAAVAVFGAVDAFACPGRFPTPILLAAGTDDPEVVFDHGFAHMIQGYTEPTVTQEAREFAAANGCTTPVVTPTTTTWTTCSSGAPVVLMAYLGAGHDWPPGMAAVIWRFFTSRADPVAADL